MPYADEGVHQDDENFATTAFYKQEQPSVLPIVVSMEQRTQ